MNKASQLQKIRKMAQKNQQRCLNSQPFSRKRAYLNRQKCQQKMVVIQEQPGNLNKTDNLFDQGLAKFNTQEFNKLINKQHQFDSFKIMKQLDRVQMLIGAIQEKNISLAQSKPQSKGKVKTSYSTRTDSVQSPKSIENQNKNKDKYFRKSKQQKLLTEPEVCRPKSEQKKLQLSCHDDNKKMMKIKSSKTMIKVYNPFPTPMAELI